MNADLVTRYVEWMRTKGLAGNLVRRRATFLRAAENYIGIGLLKATPDHISRFVSAERRRGMADSTIYIYVGHLRAFYGWAMRQGLARRNPVDAAAVPRRPRYLPRPIADGPLTLAIDTAEPRCRLILLLAALAGLRACEIARLRREDVLDQADPPQLLIHGKGDKPRAVPLADALLAELRVYGMPRRGPIVRRLDGVHGEVSSSLISTVANTHLHSLGIVDTLHALRHYAATSLYRDTKDIQLVGDILGHASPATTAIYAAWSREDAPAAMQRLATRVVLPVAGLAAVSSAPVA